MPLELRRLTAARGKGDGRWQADRQGKHRSQRGVPPVLLPAAGVLFSDLPSCGAAPTKLLIRRVGRRGSSRRGCGDQNGYVCLFLRPLVLIFIRKTQPSVRLRALDRTKMPSSKRRVGNAMFERVAFEMAAAERARGTKTSRFEPAAATTEGIGARPSAPTGHTPARASSPGVPVSQGRGNCLVSYHFFCVRKLNI